MTKEEILSQISAALDGYGHDPIVYIFSAVSNVATTAITSAACDGDYDGGIIPHFAKGTLMSIMSRENIQDDIFPSEGGKDAAIAMHTLAQDPYKQRPN